MEQFLNLEFFLLQNSTITGAEYCGELCVPSYNSAVDIARFHTSGD